MSIYIERINTLSIVVLFILVSILATTLPLRKAFAAVDTCTWTGATTANWATGSNWSGCDNGGVPETGDSLVFPESASNKATNNNLLIVAATVTVSGSGYSFAGNTFELSGTLNSFSSATYTSQVRLTNSTGQTGVNIQSSTPTFTGGINMNVTGSGYVSFFTTNSSVNLPVITGTTPSFNLSGNPTLPLEVYNTQTSAQTFTATNIFIGAAAVNCQSASNCLGNSANTITLGNGDTVGSRATLRLNALTLSLANPIIYNDFGTGGPPRIETVQSAILTGAITLATNGVISTGTGATLQVNNTVSLSTNTLTYEGTAEVVQNGAVSGLGNVVSNVGALTMVNSNTYTGTTTIMPDARINVLAANSLGTTAGATTVQSGGSVIFSPFLGPISVAENFTVSGTGDSGISGAISTFDNTDNTTLTGIITLAGDTTFGIGLAGSDLVINGVLAGTGNITFNTVAFGSDLILGGAVPNTYTGTITVTGSFLNLQKNGAVTGNIIIADNGINAFVSITAGLTDAIANTSIVTINATSSANFSVANGETETIGGLAGASAGNVFVGTGGTLTLNVTSTQTSGASFAGGGTIVKTGSGTQTLTGSCAVSDVFNVVAGTLLTSSSFITSNCDANINGGTLKAAGQWNDITGTSGIFSSGNSPGTTNISGNFTLTSGMTFQEEITGPAAGSQYDQTIVSGTATLGGATLSVIPSYTPAVGTVFTIIQAGSVSGTFNGLPNSATLVANGLTFRVNYTGTTVTLTVLSGTVTAPATGLEKKNMLIPTLALVAGSGLVLSQARLSRFVRRKN